MVDPKGGARWRAPLIQCEWVVRDSDSECTMLQIVVNSIVDSPILYVIRTFCRNLRFCCHLRILSFQFTHIDAICVFCQDSGKHRKFRYDNTNILQDITEEETWGSSLKGPIDKFQDLIIQILIILIKSDNTIILQRRRLEARH